MLAGLLLQSVLYLRLVLHGMHTNTHCGTMEIIHGYQLNISLISKSHLQRNCINSILLRLLLVVRVMLVIYRPMKLMRTYFSNLKHFNYYEIIIVYGFLLC